MGNLPYVSGNDFGQAHDLLLRCVWILLGAPGAPLKSSIITLRFLQQNAPFCCRGLNHVARVNALMGTYSLNFGFARQVVDVQTDIEPDLCRRHLGQLRLVVEVD